MEYDGKLNKACLAPVYANLLTLISARFEACLRRREWTERLLGISDVSGRESSDLLEQESVRISPDFVSVDTPFWMDHGTCCEHSSCITVGHSRASFSPLRL